MGGRLALLALAAALAGPAGDPARALPRPVVGLAGLEGEWGAIWRQVLAAAPDQRAEVARGVGLPEAPADPVRQDLLRALAGERDAAERLARDLAGAEAWPLDGGESWLAGSVLPAGRVRSRAVLFGLRDSRAGELSPEFQRIGFEAGVEAAEDLRLEEALELQSALHAVARAEWSAENLALSLRLSGEYTRADEVLRRQIEEVRDTADLWSQRGLNALGAGDVDGARRLLGVGVARGSQDAASMLARLDLSLGRSAARSEFAALLSSAGDEPGPWDLRGFGLSFTETPLPRAAADGPGAAAGPPLR